MSASETSYKYRIPVRLPGIVYKYRSWKDPYHKNLLCKNQIYLPSPEELNDPFDGVNTQDFLLLDSNDKVSEYVEQVMERQKENLLYLGLNLENERLKLIHKLKDLAKLQKEEVNNAKELRRRLGIFSLSWRWDSILMWSHYGDCHHGFCIGFSEGALRSCCSFGFWSYVQYNDEIVRIDPRAYFDIRSLFIQTFVKSKDWDYEKEYRLMKFFEKENANRIIPISNNCFSELILGINISEDDKIEIISVAKEKGIKKIFQAVRVNNKYDLERYEIL